MSKAVAKGMHWMPRTGEFSTHGQRNGRVDVLPPNASMPLFNLELESQYNALKKKYQDLQCEYLKRKEQCESDSSCKHWMKFFRKNPHERHRIPSVALRKLEELETAQIDMCGAASRLQDLKIVFTSDRNASQERLWINTAKAILPHDVVKQIDDAVKDIQLLVKDAQ